MILPTLNNEVAYGHFHCAMFDLDGRSLQRLIYHPES
jgi:hypothetical protein